MRDRLIAITLTPIVQDGSAASSVYFFHDSVGPLSHKQQEHGENTPQYVCEVCFRFVAGIYQSISGGKQLKCEKSKIAYLSNYYKSF